MFRRNRRAPVRRRPRGRRGARLNPTPRIRVAQQNNRTATRVLRATARVFLQFPNSDQGGVEGSFGFSNPVSQYVGSDFVSDNFEQYRVSRVKVLMKPSSAALNDGLPPANTQEAIEYQNSVYSLMNNTEVQSFVDYDTTTAPSYTECLTRPNLRMRALKPNDWTMVASYAPKTLSNPSNTVGVPSITFSGAKWMTTNNMSAVLRGLRGRISNRSPLFNAQANVASVDVMFAITVHMRGFKNTSDFSTVRSLPFETDVPEPEEQPENIPLKMSPRGEGTTTDVVENMPSMGTSLLSFTPEEERLISKMQFLEIIPQTKPPKTTPKIDSLKDVSRLAPLTLPETSSTLEDIQLLPKRSLSQDIPYTYEEASASLQKHFIENARSTPRKKRTAIPPTLGK